MKQFNNKQKISIVFIIVLLISWIGITTNSYSSFFNSSETHTKPEINNIKKNFDYTTNSLGMKFVYIKPGTFMMGSPSNERDRDKDETQHKVTLTKGFYLQTTEVTIGQWRAVMAKDPPDLFDSNCGNDCPVDAVSWNDSKKFIEKLNMKGEGIYRLPTEAEWEYSCRAGTTTPFNTGKCLSTDQANYGLFPYHKCPEGKDRGKPIPVASLPPNAWGLHDMHGNVHEWCEDWYGKYPSGHVTDPKGLSLGSERVERGGSFFFSAKTCRSANRGEGDPSIGHVFIGFRLVMEKEEK